MDRVTLPAQTAARTPGDSAKSAEIGATMRKRTKTGCLTCRKRRIRCGEERPTCKNCIRSKRQCEGYNQRVVFKPPIGDWPNHPGTVSSIQFHSSFLPQSRNSNFSSLGLLPYPEAIDFPISNPAPAPVQPRPFPALQYQRPDLWTPTWKISALPPEVLEPPVHVSSIPPQLSIQAYHPPHFLEPQLYPPVPTSPTPSSNLPPAFLEPPVLNTSPASRSSEIDNTNATNNQFLVLSKPVVLDEYEYASKGGDSARDGSTLAPSFSLSDPDGPFVFAGGWDTFEYLDGDYFDLESDDDSAICLIEDASPVKLALIEALRRNGTLHERTGINNGTLDFYRPQYTANPIKDNLVAQVFAFFVSVTGPIMSHFAMDFDGNLFSFRIPTLALNDLGLLHAVLALSTRQVAEIYQGSVTPSFKHYAYSLKRMSRSLAQKRTRLLPSTLASSLLLATYEYISADFVKWGTHLLGATQLLKEVAENQDMDSNSFKLFSQLFWTFAKLDVYHSILLERRLLLPIDAWKAWEPRAEIGKTTTVQGFANHLFVILAKIVDFASKAREETWIPHEKRFKGPKSRTGRAFLVGLVEWTALKKALGNLEDALTDCPAFDSYKVGVTPAKYLQSPVCGTPIFYRRVDVANIWALYHMARVILLRTRPKSHYRSLLVPGGDPPEAALAAEAAEKVGRIVSGICIKVQNEFKDPDIQRVLVDVTLPLFIASSQYVEMTQRIWTINTLRNIASSTGWKPAKEAFVSVQTIWEYESLLGRGTPWARVDFQPERSDKISQDIVTLANPHLRTTEQHLCSFFSKSSWDVELKDKLWRHQRKNYRVLTPKPEFSKWFPRFVESVQLDDFVLGRAMEKHEGDLKKSLGVTMGSQIKEELETPEVAKPAPGEVQSRSVSTPHSHVSSPLRTIKKEEPDDDAAVESDHGSMESGSSASSEDTEHDSLQTARHRVIDRVMAYFHAIFRVLPPVNRRGDGGASGNTSSLSSSRQGDGNSESAISTSIGLNKRARGSGDRNEDDNEEDNLNPKRPRKDKMPVDDEEMKRKFACPYYKRNPERYIMRRSCVGPGWDEVRRVKEHLYRNHALPIFCPRCYEIFKVDALLHEHQRADEPCKKRPPEVIEGFNKQQEKRLKSRKKTQTDTSEENKWRDMYRVVFPDDDAATMPSPYLDCDWERAYLRGKTSGSNEVARYEQFLRRELPAAVRRELENTVEREFTPLEERLKSQLIEIVRDVQLQLFQSYTHTRKKTTQEDEAPPDAETEPEEATQTDVGGDHVSSSEEMDTLENQLAAFEPAPPLADFDALDFDAILFQFQDMHEFEDSAYGSLFDSAFQQCDWSDAKGDSAQGDEDNGEGPSRPRGGSY
ncbi:hypothetical protein EJ04DRAFT_476937 [Polyplosphaeria fusca]|uniref:Zn(2)-C6 fungal-type domain-containing protein n=1 Tax=Polyplosphaeria fusca TaxID=682080 RepID=A0A9P4QLU5_9PLEO|nr:hypothetical protein EJ04DRAFT_476937 [Polyplosphaeria fusca]